jgi:hypothetical protein
MALNSESGNGAARDGGVRALVVANEAVVGDELRDRLLAHLGHEDGKVFVVAPALAGSALEHVMGDVDAAIGPAGDRLERTLAALREAGLDASGEVGDSDPMIAIGDEIQKFHPDRIVVVAHRDEEGAFAEKGLLEQLERDLDLPVTELVVDKGKAPHVLAEERTEPVAGRGKGWRPSYNWPPLTKRELGGILVAILGTLLLGILAAHCVGDSNHPAGDLEEGRLGAACVARMLIAVGVALINLAHVVGLFLFQSVGYQGLFSRFFARLSLYGTVGALAVSLLLGLFM